MNPNASDSEGEELLATRDEVGNGVAPGEAQVGLQDLLGPEYDYLEPGKWDREETRVKMGTDPDMVISLF